MSNSRVLKRKVFQIKFETLSPLSVSSGEDEWTDSDVLRNWDGEPFVPGSSLAGAMRAYLEKKKNESCLMGYLETNAAGKMSSLFISDIVFQQGYHTGVRDGVALGINKTAKTGSKYDVEILEHGASGTFYMELVVRETDNEAEMDRELARIFTGIRLGEIRLGQKKTRGFGEFRLTSIKSSVFDCNNYLEYAKAYDADYWEELADKKEAWEKEESCDHKKIVIEVPLKLTGGISIRQYAAIKGQPDFAHITDNGVPVIPGSSMNGAIRHRVCEILKRICKILEELEQNNVIKRENVNGIVDTMFGYVDESGAGISAVVVSESEIKDATPLTMTRTGVSRFESAVKKGALYKERTYVGGTVTLKILVNKNTSGEEKWMIGLLLLAIKDLQNGYLSVGGETAIGRGLFSENGPILIDGESGKEDMYIKDLVNNLQNSNSLGGGL